MANTANSKIVAVLDTMWGDRPGRAPRYFRINPYNHTGKRLYKLIGAENAKRLYVTNVCRELVTHASQHGKPDPIWLAENLRRLDPAVILVCGSVAQKAFDQICPTIWDGNGVEIYMPHPAARCWTKRMLRETERKIRKSLK